MSLAQSVVVDLEEMIDGLDDYGVFEPGEAEAWCEELAEADCVGEMMTLNEALVETVGGRCSFQEFMSEVDFEARTSFPAKE